MIVHIRIRDGMNDCHQLGRKYRASINFIKCTPIVFNTLD